MSDEYSSGIVANKPFKVCAEPREGVPPLWDVFGPLIGTTNQCGFGVIQTLLDHAREDAKLLHQGCGGSP